VVVEVLADAVQLDLDVHAVGLQVLRRADPGDLEDVRRLDRSAADDHLARGARLDPLAVLHVLDADAALALEDEARHLRMRR
jgi:hypothetical protein